MKISSINSAYCNYANYSQYRQNKITSPLKINTVADRYSYQPTFGIANCEELKTLFKYGLPCIYSGVTMIDPREVQVLSKSGIFNSPAKKSIKYLKKYKDSISGSNKLIYNLISIGAHITKDKDIQGVMQTLSVICEKMLVRQQKMVFTELSHKVHNLTPNLKDEYDKIMQKTMDKIKKVPVYEPFSSYEFKYKLQKIKSNVAKTHDEDAETVMNTLLKESSKLDRETNKRTLEHQKKVLSSIEKIVNESVLNHDEELNNLIRISKSRLNSEATIIPFSRKSFLYDISKLAQKIPDKTTRTELMRTATKLPTSGNALSAYITKMSNESSEKIVDRLLWPSFASVEHVLPQSCGGKDEMANFAGATTLENALRQSIPFTEQMKRRPQTPKYCQKNIDRLIELAHQGVFKKHGIDTQYIEDLKNTIYTQSQGKIILDTSKL